MNNFNVVFTTIKQYCPEPEVPSYKCYLEIEKAIGNNSIFPSACMYLEVLQNMELIRFNKACKTVALTEKGKNIEKLFS